MTQARFSYTDPAGTLTTTSYDQAGCTASTTRELPGQPSGTVLQSYVYGTTASAADQVVSETEAPRARPRPSITSTTATGVPPP